jgi:hypothetical protein
MYTACLRRIMGVSRAECHTLQHIHTTCGSKSLELMLIQRTFQWLGHVMRIPDHHSVPCHDFQLHAGGWSEEPRSSQSDL